MDMRQLGYIALVVLALCGTSAAQEGAQMEVTPKKISSLIFKLGDEDFATRENATVDLIQIGEKALPQLSRLSPTSNPEAQVRAQSIMDIIDAMGPFQFSRQFIIKHKDALLHIKNNDLVKQLLFLDDYQEEISAKDVKSYVLTMLEHRTKNDVLVVKLALEGLCRVRIDGDSKYPTYKFNFKLKSKPAIDPQIISKLLKDPVPEVRRLALRSIRVCPDDLFIDLLETLRDSDEDVAMDATYTISNHLNPGRTRKVLELFVDGDPNVRMRAVQLLLHLLNYNGSGYEEELCNMLEDPSNTVVLQLLKNMPPLAPIQCKDTLLRLLDHPSIEIQAEVARVAGKYFYSEALDKLSVLLKNKSEIVQIGAIKGLSQGDAIGSVQPILQGFDSYTGNARKEAMKALMELNDPRVTAMARTFIFVDDVDLQVYSAVNLILAGGQENADLLSTIFDYDSQALTDSIMDRLFKSNNPAMKELAFSLLDNTENHIRNRAVWSLTRNFKADSTDVPRLYGLLMSENDLLAGGAWSILCSISNDDITKRLLATADEFNAKSKCQLLGYLIYSYKHSRNSSDKPGPEIEDFARGLLKGNDMTVRLKALHLMSVFSWELTAEEVHLLLSGGEESIQTMVLSCIAQYEVAICSEYMAMVEPMLKSEFPSARALAISTALRTDYKKYRPIAIDMLKDGSYDVLITILQALSEEVATADSANEMFKLLDNENPIIVKEVLHYYYRVTGREATMPFMIDLLGHKNEVTREVALGFVFQYGNKNFAGKILPLLNAPSAKTRSIALDILGDWNAKEYTDDIERLCSDSDRDVRVRAYAVLDGFEKE